MGKCEGSRLVGGTRLVVFPRLPRTGRRTPRARTPTPLRAGTSPLPAGTPPAPISEGARGKGSRLERGSRLVVFSSCGHGNTTGRVPPTSRDPLPLLTQSTQPPACPVLGHFSVRGIPRCMLRAIPSQDSRSLHPLVLKCRMSGISKPILVEISAPEK